MMHSTVETVAPDWTMRFVDYRKAVSRRVVEVETTPQGRGAFRAHIVERHLGPLRVFHIQSDAVSISRSLRCIDRDPDNQYIIAFNQTGDCLVQHGSMSLDVPIETFYLLDKARPYATEFALPSSRVLVCVPRMLLEQRINDPAQFLGCVSPASKGVGRLAAKFISDLLHEGAAMSGFQQGQVAEICLDLLVMALNVGITGESSANDATIRTTSGRLLLSRIKAYMRSNLGDSTLSPTSIAEAHGISKRYLHHIFAESGTSVGACLRDERLKQARAALENPRSASRSITEIAFDCGFVDSAHFSRSFKALFGLTPTGYRVQSLRGLKPE